MSTKEDWLGFLHQLRLSERDCQEGAALLAASGTHVAATLDDARLKAAGISSPDQRQRFLLAFSARQASMTASKESSWGAAASVDAFNIAAGTKESQWSSYFRSLRLAEKDCQAATAVFAATGVTQDEVAFLNDARLARLGMTDTGLRQRVLSAIRAQSTHQAVQVMSEKTPLLVSQPPSSAVTTQPWQASAPFQPAYQKPGGAAIVPQYGPRVCYMHNNTAAWDCCQECNRPVCGLCLTVQEVFHDDDTSRHCCGGATAGFCTAMFGCFACFAIVIMRSQKSKIDCVRPYGDELKICTDCKAKNETARAKAFQLYFGGCLCTFVVIWSIVIVIIMSM